MTMRTFAPPHHDTSFATVPSLDEYSREAPEYESERKENEKEKNHRIIVRAYRGSGDWLVVSCLYALFSYWMMRVSGPGEYERYDHRYI